MKIGSVLAFRILPPGMRAIYALVILIALPSSLQAQLVVDESKLYAQTKQVNQFFRRFNGEEDEKGERYYQGDRHFRSVKLRKQYLGILFDASNSGMNLDLKTQFAKDVLDKTNPAFLDFHGPDWFCEVHVIFTMNGQDHLVTLYMQLEKDHLGRKWVISNLHASMFESYFKRDTSKIGRFIHPLSHELDFMNLQKAFMNTDSINQFVTKRFVPDHLSVFLYEIKKGNLKFKTVEQVKFHFFQVAGWYFELSDFNRQGYNTGWLISNLVKVKDQSEKDLLRRYLYHEGY